MHWTVSARNSLKEANNIPIEGGLALNIAFQKDLDKNSLKRIKNLLDNAYSTHSMWPAFQENLDSGRPVLIFTLENTAGEIIAMRGIGEHIWGATYWQDFTSYIGQKRPIGGGHLTVDHNHRRQGFSKKIIQLSNDWIRNNTAISVIFGTSVSCKAIAAYYKQGAIFHQRSCNEIFEHFKTLSMSELLQKLHTVERLPNELNALYVWSLNSDAEKAVNEIGFHLKQVKD